MLFILFSKCNIKQVNHNLVIGIILCKYNIYLQKNTQLIQFVCIEADITIE